MILSSARCFFSFFRNEPGEKLRMVPLILGIVNPIIMGLYRLKSKSLWKWTDHEWRISASKMTLLTWLKPNPYFEKFQVSKFEFSWFPFRKHFNNQNPNWGFHPVMRKTNQWKLLTNTKYNIDSRCLSFGDPRLGLGGQDYSHELGLGPHGIWKRKQTWDVL